MNRYNAILPNQEYVSNYVPLPLDTMMKAGMMKQKQYDDTIADAYKMEDLMKTVNAIDKHKDFKKSLESKYYPKIEEIADQIVKTGDLSKAQEIKRLARQWETDPLRQELENSYANYQAYQKDKIAKGDKYGEWYDNYVPFKGADESGNIAGYRYTGMGEVQNHQELAIKMMDKVKEDGSKYDDAVLGADGIIRSSKGGGEHILSSKIRNLAKGKTESFLTTKEGRDFATMLNYYNPGVDLRKAAEEYLYQAGANQIFSKSERGNDISFSPWSKDIHDNDELNKKHWATTLSQMGDQGVADMKKITEAEPENSILAKIYGLTNPFAQASGLINLFKVIVPSAAYDADIIKFEKDLKDKSKASEDNINSAVEKVSYKIKQHLGQSQKNFKESYGFNNPSINHAYDVINFFGKGKDTKTNAEYERAKAIVSKTDSNFNNLSESEKFDKVQKSINDFTEASKSNVVIVPASKQELDFKNQQIANVSGTPTEKTKQLINLGLTANGKFIDFYTGKETALEDVINETGQLKYMGQLDNSNQFGPGMNYFQGSNGKFYVSPSSLDDRSNNYIDWALHQVDNKFSKQYEVPLDFNTFRDPRSFDEDGIKVRSGIPKLKIQRDLNNKNTLDVSVVIPNDNNGEDVIQIKGLTGTDDVKKSIGIKLIEKGYSANQVLKLGF